jgi:GTP-binding protein HflX
VLEDLHLLEIPRVLVWNKSDLIPTGAGNQLALGHPGSVLVSAVQRETLRALLERIASELAERWVEAAKIPSMPELPDAVESAPTLVDPDEATTIDQMLAAAGKRVRRRVQPIH